ncbi:MAG: DUF2244 domain-containing protein [Gammaproteobacteria bacterium]|nr:DUF2244 domain-containing protein [Gammaproteobacteria bacterium]
MVEAHLDDSALAGRIILRPNASWSWQANLYLLYTLTGISIAISLGFMLMGAWLVLPYSIGALLILAACIWYCVRQCNRQEVITLSEHEVRVERGIREPRESRNYHRIWAQFLVKPAKHPWDPAIVSIRSHGEEDEIGSFLSHEDKAELIAELRKIVAAYQAVTR